MTLSLRRLRVVPVLMLAAAAVFGGAAVNPAAAANTGGSVGSANVEPTKNVSGPATTFGSAKNPIWGDYAIVENKGFQTVWVSTGYDELVPVPVMGNSNASRVRDAYGVRIYRGQCASIRMMDEYGEYGFTNYFYGPMLKTLGNTYYRVAVANGRCP